MKQEFQNRIVQSWECVLSEKEDMQSYSKN